jgi:hypothetical protein
MIDPATGDLVLDSGLRIPPFWPKADFRASPLGAVAKERAMGGAFSQADVPPQRIDGRTFNVVLHFEGDRLTMIRLADDDPRFGTSFDTADEPGRKKSHDDWLLATLGPPPYAYPWGEVGSTYDPRSESSDIYIRYR